MSEKKVLNEKDLNKVAGGLGNQLIDDTVTSANGLSIGNRVEIKYESNWFGITRTHGGYIRKIAYGIDIWNKYQYLFYVEMDDTDYSGWYYTLECNGSYTFPDDSDMKGRKKFETSCID